ncbi:MAG: NfeD family protein [Lachnospiraceae bacterium]|nr:NfeD family protein [Lachnospiraceae bacterium]
MKGVYAVVAVYWLVGIIVLLVIEALTMGLTTIWFAGGAVAAFIACVAGADLFVQIVLFVVVSLVLLIFTRPFAKRYINKETEKTNVEGIIGREARVTECINNRMDTGEAVISGQHWSARAADDNEIIDQGSMVTVEEVRGVRLIVRTMK